MPDESDERDAPEDVDDADVSDASDAPDAQRAGTDSDRTDDDADSTPEGEVDDSTPEGEVDDSTPEGEVDDSTPEEEVDDSTPEEEVDDSTPEGEVDDSTPEEEVDDSTPEGEVESASEEAADSTSDDETDDSETDDDSGGLERVDDDDSGGLQRVDSEVDPEGRVSEHPSRELPDDEERPSVPDRGVEAGFDRPEDRPEDAPEDVNAAGPGPRPHPDRTDGHGGGSDVPVGHAAGAPKPGEATPAGAGAGGGGGGGGGGTGTAGGFDPGEDDMFEGPPDDEEMPLADHIEEMVLRLAAIVTVGAVATALMFLYADRLVQLMWNGVIPGGATGGSRPHLYGPLEFVLTKIKVASLAGILIAMPVLVYQSYLFMRPGLYPKERKYYLAAVPTSLVLAAVGMAFAYFAVLPGLFQYFDYYTRGSAIVAYGLAPTFNLIVALMGLLAVVFQIPLFVMLAIMMGVTTREWLEQRRLLFWGAFAGIAFLFAPDPTGMAPFIIAVTMIILFEGTLLLLRWTGR